jgi:hypothetical protein
MTSKRFWQIVSTSLTITFVLFLFASSVQAQNEWTASIQVQNFDPVRPQTKSVTFGIHPDATDGFDAGLDETTVFPPAPAPGQPYLNVGFRGPGLSYHSIDIRPSEPWTLIIGSSGNFMVTWEAAEIASAPAEIPLFIESSDGRTVDMREVNSMSFPERGSYSLMIGPRILPAEITMVSPATGSKGTEITIEGIRFGANEQVTIDFGSAEAITTVTTDTDGSFSVVFRLTVAQPNGAVTITATGVTSGKQATDSTFVYEGPQITAVEVTGSPARPGDTITVTVIGESDGTATFSIDGINDEEGQPMIFPMTEETPNNYVGTYMAEETDELDDATVTVMLEDAAGNMISQEASQTVSIITSVEFDLMLNAGFNLIAIPVATESIQNVKELGDALGDTWSLIISLDTSTGNFQSFTPTTPETAKSNIDITGSTGLIVSMRQANTLKLVGDPWLEGDINLNPGFNLIGIPLKNENLERVINLSNLLGDSVNLIISLDTETGNFQSFTPTTPETAKSNIIINGGVGLILSMKSADQISVTGEPWSNETKYMAPSREQALMNRTISPILELDGTVPVDGLSVTARNLSTGVVMTDATVDDGWFSMTFVDFSSNGTAKIGDVFEVSFSDANAKVQVDSIRYTVTERDIQLGRIALGNMVAYAMLNRTELLQNWPNPFNPETWIPFKLKESSDVSITIHDVRGRIVRKLDLGYIPAGIYQTKAKAAYWDGTNDIGERVASGVYFYHLKSEGFSASRKMVILK